MSKQAALTRQATAILRKHGFTWAGRPKRYISPAQCQFERRMIAAPVGNAR